MSMLHKPGFVIGSGSSLTGVDLSPLQRHLIVAANRAVEAVPFATAMCFMDSFFWFNYRHIIDDFAGVKFTLASNDVIDDPQIFRLHDLGYRGFSFSLNEGVYTGVNSGFIAFQVCVGLGASHIYLLGFDMCVVKNKYHFHEPYPRPPQDPQIYLNMQRAFEDAAPLLKERGVEVFNCSEVSAISAYPKVSLTEVLDEYRTS